MHYEMFSIQLKESLSACLKAAQGCQIYFSWFMFMWFSLPGFNRELPGLVSWVGDLGDKSSCSAITASLHVLFIVIILLLGLFLILHYFGHMVLSFSTNTEVELVLFMNKGMELFYFVSHLLVNESQWKDGGLTVRSVDILLSKKQGCLRKNPPTQHLSLWKQDRCSSQVACE